MFSRRVLAITVRISGFWYGRRPAGGAEMWAAGARHHDVQYGTEVHTSHGTSTRPVRTCRANAPTAFGTRSSQSTAVNVAPADTGLTWGGHAWKRNTSTAIHISRSHPSRLVWTRRPQPQLLLLSSYCIVVFNQISITRNITLSIFSLTSVPVRLSSLVISAIYTESW